MPIEIFTRIGKLTRIIIDNNYKYSSVLVKENDNVECLMFTDYEISKAKARAKVYEINNPKRSLISLLLD